MTTMITEVYDALRDAQGVSDDKARRAAEAVAALNERFAKLDVQMERLAGAQRLTNWMVGTNFAATLAILLKLFLR